MPIVTGLGAAISLGSNYFQEKLLKPANFSRIYPNFAAPN